MKSLSQLNIYLFNQKYIVIILSATFDCHFYIYIFTLLTLNIFVFSF